MLIFRVVSHVRDLGDGARKDRPPRDLRAARAHWVRAPQDLEHLGGDVVRRQMQLLAIEPMQDTEACVAQLLGASDDRIEHRLDVGRRAADDPQDVGRRGLLLQGLGEVGVLGLQLAEQSHVLDSDDGLIGERLEQRDLGVGKGSRLGAVDIDGADRGPGLQHRNGELAPGPKPARHLDVRHSRIAQHIHYVDDGAIGDRLPIEAARWNRVLVRQQLSHPGGEPITGHEVHQRPVEAENGAEHRATQSNRVPRDRVEHGLRVGRRARDHAEDLGGRRLLLERLG